MSKGKITVYCGKGRGKTSAAFGQSIFAATKGKSVIMIKFLKGKVGPEEELLKRLEPEIKIFSFEKSTFSVDGVPSEIREEEIMNIKNGLNFAKKVLSTSGCDILILDEVLGVLTADIVTPEDLKTLFEAKEESTELIMTGIEMCEELRPYIDQVYSIDIQ